MSFDLFTACLEKVPKEIAIDFSGMSEPFKNPECTRMVLLANEKGYRVRVHTTLMGMGDKDVELLSLLPFEAFRVHVPCSENLEKITVDAQYLKVLERVASRIPIARFVSELRQRATVLKMPVQRGNRYSSWREGGSSAVITPNITSSSPTEMLPSAAWTTALNTCWGICWSMIIRTSSRARNFAGFAPASQIRH
jgi:hypothetical protein